eukprot:8304599-Ditylum_brightwellii.AAC.1
MIKSADRSRYRSMVCDLENDYTHDIDGLPKTVADAYSYIANYLPTPKAKDVDNAEGLSFVTTRDDDQNKFPHIKCRQCRTMGHYGNMCKTILGQESTLAFILGDTKPTAAGNFTYGQEYIRIPKSWIILDTGSTTNIFCNRNLLRDIHDIYECLGLNCNSGWGTTNLQGT